MTISIITTDIILHYRNMVESGYKLRQVVQDLFERMRSAGLLRPEDCPGRAWTWDAGRYLWFYWDQSGRWFEYSSGERYAYNEYRQLVKIQ